MVFRTPWLRCECFTRIVESHLSSYKSVSLGRLCVEKVLEREGNAVYTFSITPVGNTLRRYLDDPILVLRYLNL